MAGKMNLISASWVYERAVALVKARSGGDEHTSMKRPWIIEGSRSTDRASFWLLVKDGGSFLAYVVLGGFLAFVVLVILSLVGFPVEGLLALIVLAVIAVIAVLRGDRSG
jgi:hypothetical protein